MEKLRSLKVSSCIYHFEYTKFSKAKAMPRELMPKDTLIGDGHQFPHTKMHLRVREPRLQVSSHHTLPDINCLGLNHLPWLTRKSSSHIATCLSSDQHQALTPPAPLATTSQLNSWRSSIPSLKTLTDDDEEEEAA